MRIGILQLSTALICCYVYQAGTLFNSNAVSDMTSARAGSLLANIWTVNWAVGSTDVAYWWRWPQPAGRMWARRKAGYAYSQYCSIKAWIHAWYWRGWSVGIESKLIFVTSCKHNWKAIPWSYQVMQQWYPDHYIANPVAAPCCSLTHMSFSSAGSCHTTRYSTRMTGLPCLVGV